MRAPENNAEYDKMVSGQPYNPLDPQLYFLRNFVNAYVKRYNELVINETQGELAYTAALSAQAFEPLNKFSAELQRSRNEILRHKILGKMGSNVFIEPPFSVDYGFNTEVGDNFYCNFNCVFLDCAKISIGSDVMFGPGVSILTATHPLDDVERCDQGTELCKPITIGDRCWLGANCTVLPGVELGARCVVAAGSVVTKSFGSGKLLAGVPAKVLRDVTAGDQAAAAGTPSTAR